MIPPIDILEDRISAAMAEVTGRDDCKAIVRPTADPKFGDYQANGVMALAKKIKTNPRKLAEQIMEKLDLDDICEPPEVAGPGFINLRLKPAFLAASLIEINTDTDRLGIDKIADPKTIVVDFSGPNIAKQMHVGHLRSTIIGDCICRTLKFLGHNVIKQNHIGDWGTQFGMVFLGLWHICMAEKRHSEELPYYQTVLRELKEHAKDRANLKNICNTIRDQHEKDWRYDFVEKIGDGKRVFKPFLDELKDREEDEIWDKILLAYQFMNLLEEALNGMDLFIPTMIDDKEQKKPYESLSRHVTAMLQKGGNENQQEKDAWEFVRTLTLKECNKIYEQLSVTLTQKDVRGESDYNDALPGVVADLEKLGHAKESYGAICVFPAGFKNKEGQPLPFIIRKSDKAYLYATTDLAAVRYRVDDRKADAIVYVTDSRQKMHFEMLFSVARMAGWANEDVELSHVMFGSILGDDGTPLKTRSGENVKLKDLLEEAVERSRSVVEQKNPELDEDEKARIANAVGIGAVKYADYSNNRTSDYIFSFDKMLALEGNTAPYMQYAYARIKSIERKADDSNIDYKAERAGLKELSLTEPAELDLAKQLLRYGEAIESAAADYRPNYLTTYLYDLAQKFSAFYTNCPVLIAEPDKRPTRLLLCDLTAKTIGHGLDQLLGIEVVEQM